MIPIANQQHKYILMYAAKAASTSSRLLYLGLHQDEFTPQERKRLKGYHNLNEVHCYDPTQDYSEFYKFIITRNPYSRVVSAFLDQYAYAQNAAIMKMFAEFPPAGKRPDSFIEFLEYLKTVPDEERDSHFQTQACFVRQPQAATLKTLFNRVLRRNRKPAVALDFFGDIGDFKSNMQTVYAHIFAENEAMRNKALAEIDQIKKSNSSFYAEQDFDDAATLSLQAHDDLQFAPKPQDFYKSSYARELVEEIYAEDFRQFGYAYGDIPIKKPSAETKLMPDDFDWQMYLRLNPDLPADEIYNERSVARHYLEFGRFEAVPRAYKVEKPPGFDWQRYLALHEDLRLAGIDNERDAITHYISYGVREERQI